MFMYVYLRRGIERKVFVGEFLYIFISTYIFIFRGVLVRFSFKVVVFMVEECR